jgi:iron complex transport system substrate-binding protein
VRGAPVEVPGSPRRIVAVHDINAGAHLLSLGAPVVGMAVRESGVRNDISRYFDVDGIMPVGVVYEPDIESIAALAPDLIVGEGFNGAGMFDDAVEQRLEAIAPVVYIDTFRPIEEVMEDFAELVGADAQSRLGDQKEEFDGVVEEIRALLEDEWDSTTVSMFDKSSDGTLQVWGSTALAATDILTRVGARWPDIVLQADQPENGGYLGGVSLERIGDLAADVVIITTAFDTTLLDEAVFQQLGAVQAGQVVDFDEPTAGSHYPNYLFVARFLLERLNDMQPIDTSIVGEIGVSRRVHGEE